jgi:ABC-type bacteriocin/lantibiotic exporter with double-glycine peptidase domain
MLAPMHRFTRRRVRFIQQLGAEDCGATCVAMVLDAHGVHDVAPECRELCGAGRDGARLRTLASVAERYGLESQILRVAPSDVEALPLPIVAHWRSSHFVVIERYSSSKVTVVDPATGRRSISLAEFAADFSGTVLVCEAGSQVARRPRRLRPLWFDYVAAMYHDTGAQGALVQIIVASVLIQATGLATPLFTKLIVDDVAPPGSVITLTLVAFGMAVVLAARTVTSLVRSAVMIRLQTRLDARLTEGFFEHLLRLPYRFFQGRTSGDLLMRLSSHTTIREILTTQLLSVLLDGPFALLYIAVLLAVAPTFAVVVVALSALQAGLVLVSLRSLVDLGQRSLVARSDEQSCLVELMKGVAHLKASGTEERALERWRELFRRQLSASIERSALTARIDVALGLVRSGSPLVLLWYGAKLVQANELPLGTMLALCALASSFLTPFMAVVQSTQQLQLLDAYIERLVDVLRVEPERRRVAPTISVSRRSAKPAIEARELSFRFASGGPIVIDDVSFTVARGEQLGIVGATGSGKSTILMLLLGLYEPTDGLVLFDGVPLSELDPVSARRRCGVVLQDVALFGGSLRSNIALSAPDAPLEQVAEAARLADLDDDIRGMPLRYETRLSEGGTSMSGGQRQRIAIARAVLTRPEILLLDEATSHLDVAAERRVIANLDGLGCTRIAIAHRLSTVRASNQILVLERGRVVERGSHAELVRLGRAYAALAAQQDPTASMRRPGADGSVARVLRVEPHGHRGCRAST